MNTAETIRKAINATKGRLTKRQVKAVRRKYLREKLGWALRHLTMDRDPKKVARNKARRERQAARGYELWDVAHVDGRAA